MIFVHIKLGFINPSNHILEVISFGISFKRDVVPGYMALHPMLTPNMQWYFLLPTYLTASELLSHCPIQIARSIMISNDVQVHQNFESLAAA